MEHELQNLPRMLLPWYEKHKRDLPWRRDRDAYHVWLSEIMLQQTRVEAVKGYYNRFLNALPDLTALANADDDLLHKLWEGLGYYNRVRNLKLAAITIMQRHGGVFPSEYEAVRSLPGIGDYTAGAICSICFGQRTPAVDGNVLRVLSRLTGDETPIDLPASKRNAALLLSEIYPDAAGDFTQALMELGATVCIPNGSPNCPVCPCAAVCKANALGITHKLPVRQPKKRRRTEDKTVFILSCEDRFALVKRPEQGLLAGLWQFPETPGILELREAISTLREQGICVKEICRQADKKHVFTHIEWNMRGYYLEVRSESGPFVWMTRQEIETRAALPTAYRQFWDMKNSVR